MSRPAITPNPSTEIAAANGQAMPCSWRNWWKQTAAIAATAPWPTLRTPEVL